MKKRYILAGIGALGATVAAGYVLKDEKGREELKKKMKIIKEKITNCKEENLHTTLEAAGIPDQVEDDMDNAQMNNADMVSEGSQYGVNYYNEVQEEKE